VPSSIDSATGPDRAKIVEVNLDRSFQFGIDWSAVARAERDDRIASGLPARLPRPTGGAPTGNIEFTLTAIAGDHGGAQCAVIAG